MTKANPYLKWLMCILLFSTISAHAQETTTLTLDQCLSMAQENYPAIKQYKLIDQSRDYAVSNIQKAYLPQLAVAGQASYQSDVTQIPFTLPNMDIPSIDKEQFRLYAEITQPITDLFVLKDQRELIETNSQIEKQKLDVEMYKVRDRVIQLYFGLMMMDEQLLQTTLLQRDIQIGIDKITVAIEGGTASVSSLNTLKAELLKVDQRVIELKAGRTAFAKMLSYFTNTLINENTQLQTPESQIISKNINRPELKLFDLQVKSFDVQSKLITAKNLPRFNLFFQSGYGRPALNMLSNDFQAYYIGGIRLNWNLTGLYTYNREKKIIRVQQSVADVQKEGFLFNTELVLHQQLTEIQKVQDLIDTDNDIILLREEVKNTMKTQLENGTATSNDYLISVNAADQARQNLILHKIQLLLAQYNYQTSTGNE